MATTERKTTVRFDLETFSQLETKAKTKKTTVPRLISQYVKKSLENDLEIQNELVSTLGNFKNEILNAKREVRVLSSMFTYWLRFYFTLSAQDFETLPEGAARRIAFQDGDIRRDKFIAMFRKSKENQISLVEQLYEDAKKEEKEGTLTTQEEVL